MEAENTGGVGLLIDRDEKGLNREMPFASLADWVTPTERFYVRSHFPVPDIDAAGSRLRLEGAVARPVELTLAELQKLPTHTIAATLECAGNGRSSIEPKVEGVPWDLGAVGNARWTGVLLRDVLEQAGVTPDCMEVVLEGADRGVIAKQPSPPGEVHYARGVPVAKAMRDVLLAFAMNGEPLTAEHGAPVRAVVPGWFGMASVKWLRRIIASETRFAGYYQSIDYTFWDRRDGGLPTLKPLSEMRVKAQIARPAAGESVSAGSDYRVFGAAWGSDAEVTSVEFSSDGGENWSAAELLGEPVRHAWRLWQFHWRAPAETGQCTLLARATDSAGRGQPRERNQDYATYMVNHWLPVVVNVR